MSQFVLIQNFFVDRKLETTKVLGVFASLTDAQAYANGLIKEMRDNMEWEDEAPKWVWNDQVLQWSTTDFPPDDIFNQYIIDTL